MKKIEFDLYELNLIKRLINQAEWNKKLNPLYNSIISKIEKDTCPEHCPDSNFCLACPFFDPDPPEPWSYGAMENNMEGVAK